MTKTNQSTLKRVTKIVIEQLSVEPAEVTPSADLYVDLNADSLDQVELAMILEEAFSIQIPDEDIEPLRTVEQIVAYLDTRLAQ